MAERLRRAQPNSLANHVTARSTSDWRALTWLVTETGWGQRKRSAICGGKLISVHTPHDYTRREQEIRHLEYICVSLWSSPKSDWASPPFLLPFPPYFSSFFPFYPCFPWPPLSPPCCKVGSLHENSARMIRGAMWAPQRLRRSPATKRFWCIMVHFIFYHYFWWTE